MWEFLIEKICDTESCDILDLDSVSVKFDYISVYSFWRWISH